MDEQLVVDNMKLVYSIIHKRYPSFRYDEDLIQCGMVGLCKAAETWDKNKSKFSTYASSCIMNEIAREFRKRMKHDGVLSLDTQVPIKDGEQCSFLDVLVGEENIDYVNLEDFYSQLTPRRKEIFRLKQMGMSSKQISERLSCSVQAVDAHIRKMKALWRDVYGN